MAMVPADEPVDDPAGAPGPSSGPMTKAKKRKGAHLHPSLCRLCQSFSSGSLCLPKKLGLERFMVLSSFMTGHAASHGL